MEKYYIENGKIKLNRYYLKYKNNYTSSQIETTVETIQYADSETQLNNIKQELISKGIPFVEGQLDIEDIKEFEGVEAASIEDARRIIEPSIDEIKADKISEIKEACQQAIFNGVDVKLSDNSIKHFSLTIQDQQNLNNLMIMLLKNTTSNEIYEIYYHADGELCQKYSRDDFTKIFVAASEYIEKNRNYCNYLMNYTKTLDKKSDIIEVKYGMEIPQAYMSIIKN